MAQRRTKSIIDLAVSGAYACCFAAALVIVTNAQSTDQQFPTAVTTNEISGTIQPRDIGDSRLTSYYYTFDGGQGDVFINIVSGNLNGDIDLFVEPGLRPLTKIVVYAGREPTETGRVVYLRKPERLVLRIQGRTPNDDPGIFRIKFAGSFIALNADAVPTAPELPRITSVSETGQRVNTVGTVIPSPPVKAAVVIEAETRDDDPIPEKRQAEVNSDVYRDEAKRTETNEPASEVPETAVAADKVPSRSGVRSEPARSPATPRQARPAATRQSTQRPRKPGSTDAVSGGTETKAEPAPDPLAGMKLVIYLKDGGILERPLPEVLRFSVDKGVLTVVSKNGFTNRYSMLDVQRVVIE
jgi:hypothetical protein